jgi:hypothetical protein
MGDFAKYILFDDIQQLFDELDSSLADPQLRQARLLNPKTMQPWRARDRWKQLRAVVDDESKNKGVDPSRLWVTFSQVSKFGQHPKVKSSGKSTPVGIFGFPVNYVLEQERDTPFADRPYLHVFRAKSPHLEVGLKNASHKFLKLKDKFIDYRHKSGVSPMMRDTSSIHHKLLSQMSNHKLHMPFIRIGDIILKQLYSLGDVDGTKYIELLNSIDPKQLIEEKFDYKSKVDSMKEYLSQMQYYHPDKNEYFRRFKDVHDDLSAVPEPDFVEYMKKHYGKEDFPSGRMSFEDITNSHYEFFGDYGHAESRLNDLKMTKVAVESEELVEATAKYIEQLKAIIEKNAANPLVEPDFNELPYAAKLRKYAEKHGLDFKKAAQTAIDRASNAKQFAYRTAEQLARQTQEKSGGHWQMDWNRILRDIGYSAVADTMDSGHIHSSEKTQGVFLNPEKIEYVTTIVQRSHSDKNDPANRPTKDMWRQITSHDTTVDPTNQRRGTFSFDTVPNGQDKEDWFNYGLIQRVTRASHDLHYYGTIYPDMIPHFDLNVSSLIKAGKAHARMLSQGYKPKDPRSDLKTHLGAIVHFLKATLERSRQNLQPDVINKMNEKINILDRLAKGEQVKTPIYKRSLHQQPVQV